MRMQFGVLTQTDDDSFFKLVKAFTNK
jgi:hypothetical protein